MSSLPDDVAAGEEVTPFVQTSAPLPRLGEGLAGREGAATRPPDSLPPGQEAAHPGR